MFQQILFIHWKGIRFGLLPLMVVSFGLPLLVVQGLVSGSEDPEVASLAATGMLGALRAWAPLLPLIASIAGVTLALSAWAWDHRQNHVYSLSLPFARWEYVLLKMGGGAVLLLLPCIAFWIGAVLATSSLEIPIGLRAYPTAVAIRFLLTALIIYSALFALAAGTFRTAIWILFLATVLLVSGEMIFDFLGRTIHPSIDGFSFLEWALDLSLSWPGPFEVLTGSWMLIDV